MKSPTDDLLDLCEDLNAEPRAGFTGGLDLYDELTSFGISSAEPTTDNGAEPFAPSTQYAPTEPARMSESSSMKAAADSGPLAHTGDVIRITGMLTGYVAARTETVVCGDCGNRTDGSEMFCNHCGGLLDAATASAETAVTLASLCDECGARVESDEIFCPSCGTVMATA
jgi:hypothetical protein